MKVLIIGRGVVGTIYGWALSKAGIGVTHVVRKEALASTDTLDLLDLRPGYPKNTRVTYAPKTVGQISPSDSFHLVIVATKHYQAAEAIRQYFDVLNTGEQMGVPMPQFSALGEKIEC